MTTNSGKPAKALNIAEKRNFVDGQVRRYFRNLKGYSQRQVGEKNGVSEDTYRRYEVNEIEVTDIKKIKKIITNSSYNKNIYFFTSY